MANTAWSQHPCLLSGPSATDLSDGLLIMLKIGNPASLAHWHKLEKYAFLAVLLKRISMELSFHRADAWWSFSGLLNTQLKCNKTPNLTNSNQ